ncbi:spexin [Ahaetulla prasina]|uniref:spexin n=1 Tax=Ahaetulla prasina TaxID=499056 RepID=UPI0026495192|nr:spexin [Ahaetulla prasina]
MSPSVKIYQVGRLHRWTNGPLALYLLASFITFSWGVPQLPSPPPSLDNIQVYVLFLCQTTSKICSVSSKRQAHFQRRNWTPQAMLYLKGAQGRRFVSEESQQKALYDRLMQDPSSQNVNPLTLSEDVLLLLSSLPKMQNEENEEKAPERTGYFADGLLNW